jgi:hypothetical protein
MISMATEARPYRVFVFIDLPGQPRQWAKTWPDPSNRGTREYTSDRALAQLYTSRSGSAAAMLRASKIYPDAEIWVEPAE